MHNSKCNYNKILESFHNATPVDESYVNTMEAEMHIFKVILPMPIVDDDFLDNITIEAIQMAIDTASFCVTYEDDNEEMVDKFNASVYQYAYNDSILSQAKHVERSREKVKFV